MTTTVKTREQDQRVRQQGADLLVGHDPRAAAPRRDGPRRAAGVGKTIEDLRRRAVAQKIDHLQELLGVRTEYK